VVTVSADTEPAGDLAGEPKEDLMDRARELDAEADPLQVDHDLPYLAEVGSVQPYGVFVNLTPPWGSDITGLIHQSKLPSFTNPRDFSPGEGVVVELIERKDDGDLAFRGLYSPDVDAGTPDIAAVHEQVTDLTERVDGLADAVEGMESSGGFPGPDGEEPTAVQGIPAAARELKRLHASGYQVESFATASRNGGEVVELDLTVSKSETGDTDE
jgi:hypothetical protein